MKRKYNQIQLGKRKFIQKRIILYSPAEMVGRIFVACHKLETKIYRVERVDYSLPFPILITGLKVHDMQRDIWLTYKEPKQEEVLYKWFNNKTTYIPDEES